MIRKVIISLCSISYLWTNPSNPSVVSGSATFQTSGNKYIITTLSDDTIIDWEVFSNDSNELIDIEQPNLTSQILLRVTSTTPSNISGLIKSNGKVILVNTNGIILPGIVDVQSFIGSTLDLSNLAFLAGLDLDFIGSSSSAIENLGDITGHEFIGLFSRHIINSGSVYAVSAHISLAAGDAINYDPSGNIVTISPTLGTPAGTGIDHSGDLASYTVEVKANGNLYNLAIQYSGTAFSIPGNGAPGFVSFLAENGELKLIDSGSVLALSDAGGGGVVYLLGETVTLEDNVEINISNSFGGGDIFIGGSFGGLDPEILNAQNTFFGTNVLVNTSAEIDGNAGNVSIWADDTTTFNGKIQATGGLAMGNGGTVEVSGGNSVDVTGSSVDTSAENGVDGVYTIDPETITICDQPLKNLNTIKTSHLIELLKNNHVILKANKKVDLPTEFQADKLESRLIINIKN